MICARGRGGRWEGGSYCSDYMIIVKSHASCSHRGSRYFIRKKREEDPNLDFYIPNKPSSHCRYYRFQKGRQFFSAFQHFRCFSPLAATEGLHISSLTKGGKSSRLRVGKWALGDWLPGEKNPGKTLALMNFFRNQR